nr:MAG: hypothetical protein [Lake Baikal virophage 16]
MSIKINEFSNDILDTIKKMSFSNGKNVKLYGTKSKRNIFNTNDYDLFEIVRSSSFNNIVKKFQKIIISLLNSNLTYIGDIKAGVINDFKVLSDTFETYNSTVSKNKLDYIYNLGLVEKEDYNSISKMLKEKISKDNYLILEDLLKYHIMRWKPKEILNGYKMILNNKYYLVDALNNDSFFKLDVIALTENNKFSDLSIVYQLIINNKPINKPFEDHIETLKGAIKKLSIDGKYYKMSKRIAALYRATDNKKLYILEDLFNSQLGILSSIISDIETLEYLIENQSILPVSRIQFEIDLFKPRLSNVDILSNPLRNKILSTINNLLTKNKIDKDFYLLKLDKIKSILSKILNLNTKKYLLKYKIYNI